MSNVGREIAFRLPFSESKQFSGLLRILDTEKEKYGISSYLRKLIIDMV